MIRAQLQNNQYKFGESVFEGIKENHYAKNLWPVVYILSDGNTKLAYVGETTDAYARMSTHLKNHDKSRLTSVHLITSDKFNKSATLDIESNLIKYMSGDNQFRLLNGNIGLANHNYYQKKDLYRELFHVVWDRLRAEGIAQHSLEHIDNSDLFKYSPYKSLTREQSMGLLQILKSLANGTHKNTLIEGGSGTGKTILAVFLFKMLSGNLQDFSFGEFGSEENKFLDLVRVIRKKHPDMKMALVVPMASFRKTLKKIFKNIGGLNANMVIGPAEVARNKYDLLVVDESHRLRRRVNLGSYYGGFDKACSRLKLDKHKSSELDWVLIQSEKTVLFYDAAQSIKPSDVRKEDFDKLKKSAETEVFKLKSQFRVKGDNDYVEFVDGLLNGRLDSKGPFETDNYELLMFDSLKDMISMIRQRESEYGLARLMAGYSWEWKSKKNPSEFDINIEGINLKWNSTSIDWINSRNALEEVGCIHTTQGYDLNYAGLIFGNEITYDPLNDKIVIRPENYFDRNGKQTVSDPEELKAFIVNIYKTMMLRGIMGTYIYVCDPELREYFRNYIPLFEKEEKGDPVIFSGQEPNPGENAVPLYDLRVAAGAFSERQQPEEIKWIKLPEPYRRESDFFACRVFGESMNKVIPNGAYCLFRKYRGGSRNGKIVLVEYTELQDPDFGSHYTVKEYRSRKSEDEFGWRHEEVILKPRSTNPEYKDIVLRDDELRALRVIGVFECILA